ncbi:hypothetical protein COCON_G00098950 [Conger conger]|uniref:SH3 domain-binding glutamic acid-rich-like protein n=1 Tax=Conger conger TaxID=82655 RepID=A0A9Q1I1P2_CONCO|nr:SH3 domain-binding glutamic acid-rich-like protein 3 [Conger conger]KAJ8275270.1 hypothetical protein COCON_G00098950 [Conger conger]
MSVTVYFTSVTGSLQTKNNQTKIIQLLESKKIQFETVDISQSTDLRTDMREKCGNPKALPPQIFNGDAYCGDFAMFEEAVEMETVEEFLKLK